jgi:hypothetical protein
MNTDFNINEVVAMLLTLNMDFSIQHTNDYSSLTLPRNNEFQNCEIIFDTSCGEIKFIRDEE